jgi:SAM-dependent methyltransferase
MSLRKIITRQFEHPEGILGRVVGYILATRGSNLLRNRWTVDLLAPSGDERVLEIGFGPGVALELCLSAAPGVRAVGIDHSALMIAKAARRNRAAVKSGRLKLYEGSVDALPASAPEFDKAFSNNVIQFVDDQQGFLANIAAHLRPGGALVTTYQPRHARATRTDALKMVERLTEIYSRCGFEELRWEELDLRPAPAVCVLGKKGQALTVRARPSWPGRGGA